MSVPPAVTQVKQANARSPVALGGAVLGALLFGYSLYSEGTVEILSRIRGIGIGFLFVLILSAIRMAVRAKAWALCVEGREQLTFPEAFVAFVTGDALGNLSPLGPFVSESTKALLSRRHLPAAAAVSSVVLENIFYSASAAVMVTVGTVAFVLGFRPAHGALTITAAIVLIAIIAVAAVWWLLSTQPRLLSRFLPHEAIRDTEAAIFSFVATRHDRLVQILLLEFAFHAASILETFCLLSILIGRTEGTPLVALVMATVERLITIAFKFVPLRLGVDQMGTGQVAEIMGIGSATGVTLATVRTARNLFWTLVGLLLLLKRGISMGQASGSGFQASGSELQASGRNATDAQTSDVKHQTSSSPSKLQDAPR